jgi:hypothetical protein
MLNRVMRVWPTIRMINLEAFFKYNDVCDYNFGLSVYSSAMNEV